MTKPEAIIEMVMKGEKIRHFEWEKDNYILYDFEYNLFVTDGTKPISINDIHDYDLPHGFEIYKEPVTKYLWVLGIGERDSLTFAPDFYADEEELKSNVFSRFNWCERIEATAKEF